MFVMSLILSCFLFRYNHSLQMTTMDKLKKDMQCHICRELYMDPRCLTCGHSFCFHCIVQCQGNRPQGHGVPCPLCRSVTEKEISELPKNYAVCDVLEDLNKPLTAVYCDKHLQRKLEIFCMQCEVPLCTMCLINNHNGHNADMDVYCDRIRTEMTEVLTKVTCGIDRCKDMLIHVERVQLDLQDKAEETELDNDERADHMKNVTDSHKQMLKKSAVSDQGEKMKSLNNLHEDLQTRLSTLGSYKETLHDVKENGTDYDILSTENSFKQGADELLIFDSMEQRLDNLCRTFISFTFMSSNYINDNVDQTMGCLRWNVSRKGVSIRVH